MHNVLQCTRVIITFQLRNATEYILCNVRVRLEECLIEAKTRCQNKGRLWFREQCVDDVEETKHAILILTTDSDECGVDTRREACRILDIETLKATFSTYKCCIS